MESEDQAEPSSPLNFCAEVARAYHTTFEKKSTFLTGFDHTQVITKLWHLAICLE